MHSPLLENLIEAFRCIPGIGPKSAQRMVYYLLERDREGARKLANALHESIDTIGHCILCRNFCETEICAYCTNQKRDHSLLCIVESPIDVKAIEQSTEYRGLYFVLMGHLSPLDGIGPEEIGLNKLSDRLQKSDTKEIILATNPTVEGEATAHYIGDLLRQTGIKITRIAHGIPFGGELDYVDRGTLAHAFSDRKIF